MRAHIIENGFVVNTIIVDGLNGMNSAIDADEHGGGIGWLWNGQVLSRPQQPGKSPDQVRDEVIAGAQARLDDFAHTRQYDGILSACTYATSPTQKFSTEGQYCVIARDATWTKLYEILAEVEAGTRPIPSGYSDIEPELPALAWPA